MRSRSTRHQASAPRRAASRSKRTHNVARATTTALLLMCTPAVSDTHTLPQPQENAADQLEHEPAPRRHRWRHADREGKTAQRVSTLGAAIWTPGEKPSTIDLLGTKIKLSLLGYVKLDTMHDFGALGLGNDNGFYNSFITGEIPVEGTEAAERTGRTGFTANHTRFSVTISTPTPLGELTAFTQVQFNEYVTGRPDPYLRQGYLQFGNALVGRAWSTFTPTAPIPFTLDYEGPSAIPEFRQALFRWTQPLPEIWNSRVYLAVAVEEPDAQLTLPTDASAENPIPDIVLRLNLRRDWFNIYLSGVYRQLRAEGGGFNDTVSAGGASFSGSIDTIGSDNLQFGIVGGYGVGRYIQDMQDLGLDAAPSSASSTRLRTIPAVGGWLGYQHWWTSRLRSTATYSHVRAYSDFVPFVTQDVPPSAGIYQRANYASLNLIWSPFDPLDLGIEYLWGNRETTDGRRGQDNRIQLSAILFFGASS